MTDRTTSGRRLLAGAAAATVPVAVQVESLAPHPDAELLALGVQLAEGWDHENRAWALVPDKYYEDSPSYVRADEFTGRTTEIVDQIAEVKATTIEGLRVKGQAIAWNCMEQPITAEEFDRSSGPPSTQARLLAGLLRDLAGEAPA